METCAICLELGELVPEDRRPYPDLPTCAICADAIWTARRAQEAEEGLRLS